jgi:hypothetical protein
MQSGLRAWYGAKVASPKGTSFHVVLELEHVKPVDHAEVRDTQSGRTVLPAFALRTCDNLVL